MPLLCACATDDDAIASEGAGLLFIFMRISSSRLAAKLEPGGLTNELDAALTCECARAESALEVAAGVMDEREC